MSIAQLLVVEDEIAIRDMLVMALEQAGFGVQCAENAQQAQMLLDDMPPDLIVLDWMLPGLSGMEWAKRLRRDERYRAIPIILVTARGEEEDKVRGLETGADDYVTKPFSPRELVARAKAVLRRVGKPIGDARIMLGGILLDMEQHRVIIDNQPLPLSPTEYRMLEFFMTHPDKVYSRSQLLDQVWGRTTYIDERTVDVHIRRLRKTLADFARENLVQTVRGFGYRFSESA
ncbi:MAG: phosphate regulon transcriptional regulatory protein PhoB [Methylococcaceae bacterium]|nr:MAG: phosphate regulon transcriptional regulatory protein PhoB [Methylococcaceae bacterium]